MKTSNLESFAVRLERFPWTPFAPAALLALLCLGPGGPTGTSAAAQLQPPPQSADTRRVGDLGRQEALLIQGNQTFSRADIIRSLRQHIEYHAATRSPTPLAAYQKVLQRMVQAGYMHAGFPEAVVRTSLDAREERVVLTIKEGPRYSCGQIQLSGSPQFLTEPLRRKITESLGGQIPLSLVGLAERGTSDQAEPLAPGRRFRKVFRLEGTDFLDAMRGKTPAGGAPSSLLSPYFLEGAWVQTSPAPFDESSRRVLEGRVLSVLSAMGFLEPSVDLKIVPDPALKRANLVIAISAAAFKGSLAEIEVTGVQTNTRDQVLTYLNLKPGLELDLSLVNTWSNRLWESARFVEQNLTLTPLPDPGRFKLTLNLVELPDAPALGQDFSPEQQALLRLREWLLRWDRQPENLVFDVSVKAGNIAVEATMVVSGSGTVVLARPDYTNASAPLAYAMVAAPKLFGFYSPSRQQKLVRAAGLFALQFAVRWQATQERGSIGNMSASFRGGLSTDERPGEGERPIGLELDLAPAVFVQLAADTRCNIDGDVLTLGLDLEDADEFSARIDTRTGRLLRCIVTERTTNRQVRVEIRTEEGAFRRALDHVATTTTEHPNMFRPDAPLSSGLAFMVRDSLGLARWILSRQEKPDPRLRTLAVAEKLDLDKVLAPLNAFWPSVEDKLTEGPFVIPPENPASFPPGFARLLHQYVILVLQLADEFWPPGSWPWLFHREAFFTSLGRGRDTGDAITSLIQSGRAGPLASALAIELFGTDNPQLQEACAKRILVNTSQAAFLNDLQAVVGEATVASRLAAYGLPMLRSLTDEDLAAWTTLLGSNTVGSVREVVQWSRQHQDQTLAEALTSMVKQHWDDTLQPDLLEIAIDTLKGLGSAWQSQGETAKAETLYQEALTLAANLEPPEYRLQTTLLHNLGSLQHRLGREADAEKTYRELLNLRDKLPDSEHPRLLLVQGYLAQLLQHQGRHTEVETVLRDYLDLQRQTLGPEHLDVACALDRLANALERQNKLKEAEDLYRQSLTMHRKCGGADHKHVPAVMESLSDLLQKQGRWAEAETNLLECVAWQKRQFGQEVKAVAALHSLGMVRQRQGKWPLAEAAFREGLDLLQRVAAPEPHMRPVLLLGLSLALVDQSRIQETETAALESLSYWKTQGASNLNDLAICSQILALALGHLDRCAEAERHCRETLERLRQQPGPEHPFVASILDRLAHSLEAQGKSAEAVAAYRESLALRRKPTNQNDPGLGQMLHDFAALLLRMGQPAEAEWLYRESMEIEQKGFGPMETDRPRYFEHFAHYFEDIAKALAGQGKLAEAVQFLTPQVDAAATNASLLRARGNLLARRGKWSAAAADMAKAIELNPADQWDWHRFTLLLLEAGDLVGYHAQCRNMLARFKEIEDSVIAGRTARDCLLVPASGTDLDTACRGAERAVALGQTNRYLSYFQFGKGLAAYRQGHFTNALEWTRKMMGKSEASDNAETNWCREVWAYAVVAMAQQQLQQTDEARQSLAQAIALAETRLPKLESGDLGDSWPDWLTAHLLLREAQELIEPGRKDSP